MPRAARVVPGTRPRSQFLRRGRLAQRGIRPADHVEPMEIRLLLLARGWPQRNPELGIAAWRKGERGRQHTDDGVRHAAEHDRLAEHRWIAAETFLPRTIGQHHNESRTAPGVLV